MVRSKTKTAILCSDSKPTSGSAQTILQNNTDGDVLRLIDCKKGRERDLNKYDRIFVLFDPTEEDRYEKFIEFCDMHREHLKNAVLVLACPVDPNNGIRVQTTAEQVKTFLDEIWSKYHTGETKKEIVLAAENDSEKIIVPLSTCTGHDWKQSGRKKIALDDYSLILIPYRYYPVKPREPDKTVAQFMIIIGMLLLSAFLILTVVIIYSGAYGALRILAFLMFGIILVPLGRSSILFCQWLDLSHNYEGRVSGFWSFVPGTGYLRTNNVIGGLFFLSVFTLPIIVNTLAIAFSSSEFLLQMIPYTFILWLTGCVWTLTDVDTEYDRSVIENSPGPYLNTFLDLGWIRNKKRLSGIVMCSMFFICGSIQIICDFGIRELNYVLTAFSFIVMIFLSITQIQNYSRKYPFTENITMPKTRTAVLHSGVICSREARCIAKRYSADILNMFKTDPKKPLDLSSYDNVLIDFFPKSFKKIPKNYLRFFEVNAELLKRAGFLCHLEYSLRPSWSLEKLPKWLDSRLRSYDEEFKIDYVRYIVPISDLSIDTDLAIHLSSDCDLGILRMPEKQYPVFKNSILICPVNLNFHIDMVTLYSALAVMPFFIYFMGMVFGMDLLIPACAAVSIALAAFLIRMVTEILTDRPKLLLYEHMIKHYRTSYVKLYSILPVCGLIVLSLPWVFYLF